MGDEKEVDGVGNDRKNRVFHRHFSIGSLSKEEIISIVGADAAELKRQEMETYIENRKKLEPNGENVSQKKVNNMEFNNKEDDLFKPKNTMTRTPPSKSGNSQEEHDEKYQNSKRRRCEFSPENELKSNNIYNSEIMELSTTDMLEIALNSFEILHETSETANTAENNKKKMRYAIFTLHKMVTKLAYRVGQVEKENLELTIRTNEYEHMPVRENFPLLPTNKQILPQQPRKNTQVTTTEKTYSRVLGYNKTEQPQLEKWTTPPKVEKHSTIIKLKDVNDPKKVLKEIKQSLNTKGDNQQSFKNVRQLQGGGVLVECQDKEQQVKLKETLKTSKNFEIKEIQNTDPMIMFTGIETGYEAEEFIEILIQENPEMQRRFNDITGSKFKFITKRECKNNRRENWVFQTDPTVFKWLIKNDNLNFDLTKVYMQEYYNIAMCYKCCLFGHVFKYCKGEVCCPKCGDKHESNQCPEDSPLDCPNCKKLNLKDRKHTARDPRCPTFIRKIQKYREATNYGKEEREKNTFLG